MAGSSDQECKKLLNEVLELLERRSLDLLLSGLWLRDVLLTRERVRLLFTALLSLFGRNLELQKVRNGELAGTAATKLTLDDAAHLLEDRVDVLLGHARTIGELTDDLGFGHTLSSHCFLLAVTLPQKHRCPFSRVI